MSRYPLTQPSINEPKAATCGNPVSARHRRQNKGSDFGTLPSDVSLAKGQYYANPSNDFWKLVGQVLNQNVVTLP